VVFSSIEFLWLFMPVTLVAYGLAPPRARNYVLAFLSVVFYAWGAHGTVVLFLLMIAGNYVAGRGIGRFQALDREQAARRVMWAAVAADLTVLAIWKYAEFAVRQVADVLDVFGAGDTVSPPSIVLPIGISFFTFHAISYVVDITRGRAAPMRRVSDYAQYMAFFPQLIAGPIIRYHEIADQIRHPPPRSRRLDDMADGFPRFSLGLAKKVLIADQVAPISSAAFGHADSLTSPAAWLGALAYTVQIYFDFSGYSDMAIGLGRMFGFRFPENFNRPYSSVSVTDFWRRWHMTLSRWFRDYVYIPLGGSRAGDRTTYRNLLLVFLLVGLWHGAAWTFVLWGMYHGALLIFERRSGIRRLPDDYASAARRAATFLLVVLGWVLFRAADVGDALAVYRAMFALDFGALPTPVDLALTSQAVVALGIGLASVLLPRNLVVGRVLDGAWAGAPLLARGAVVLTLPLSAITVAAGSFSPFLYFQF
jgi:alginate O-acetyltransferase complex protein AlgI